jgi:hypothetical protein
VSTGGSTHWRPGTRLARLRSSHGYGWVLLLTIVAFVFAASAPDTDWARAVFVLLESATLALAIWTSGVSRDLRVASVLGLIGVIAAVVTLVTQGSGFAGAIWIVNVLLVAATVLAIGIGIIDQGQINTQSITGAVSVYVLIGILFTFAYGAAAALGSGPFFAQGTDGTTSLRLYFSYVTLATLGYGDYTPAGNFGHTLAVFEALLGQVYLVTVVALLVGNMGGRRMKGSTAAQEHGNDDPST